MTTDNKFSKLMSRLLHPTLIALAALILGLQVAHVEGHGTNPSHISMLLGPGMTGTVTSTPFSSSHTEACVPPHSITYCHHHSNGLGVVADWSGDIGSGVAGTSVYLSALGYPEFVDVTNYIVDVLPMCSASDPAGYLVVSEQWARSSGTSTWYKISVTGYGHISPTVVKDGWYWPGTLLGYANSYTQYPSCFTGAHLHMDAFNYAHYAGWYNKAWYLESVTYSSSYWSSTVYGILGGTGGTGPDGHGGAWTGY